MPTPTDPAAAAELSALRERAYGRDADIHGDPAALARWRELEDLAAAAGAAERTSAAVPAPAVPAAPAPDRDLARVPEFAPAPDPGADAGPGPRPDADPDAAGADPADADPVAPRPWWRRLAVLWPASVAAAVLVGVGLTLAVQAMEAGRVDSLQVDPDAEWPAEVWGGPTEDSRAFETFYGISVLSQPQAIGAGTQDPVPCIIVFSGMGENPSYLGGACGAGTFPAQASMLVDSSSPAELRERFRDGTALQFVLDGSQVHVYARDPGIVTPTP